MVDFVKLALSPAVTAAMSRAAKGFGAGSGMGGLVGAGLGGAAGAVKGYQNQREQGASTLGALAGGAKGLVGGAVAGTALGAGAGGVLGAVSPTRALNMTRGAQPGWLQGASHFGQRQVHALTGVGDKDYVRSIGGGAHDAITRHGAAQKAMAGLSESAPGYSKASKELAQAQKGRVASEHAESLGITSLPGYAKALWKNPSEALAAGAKEQWHSMGNGGRALMYGLPAAGVAGEAMKAQPDQEGRGRFERAGRMLGAGTSALAALPIAGDLAFGGAATSGLGRLGRRVDRRLARRPPASLGPEPAGGEAAAEGHVLSDRAAGTVEIPQQ